MPTRDRKYYIKRHNEVTEAENKQSNGMELGGDALNNVADRALQRGGRS